MAPRIVIRALVQINRLQPIFAAYNGATVQGSIPLAGDTILIGEVAPGNEVFTAIDKALKASRAEATSQIVEREFGFFILRSPFNSEVVAARDAILSHLGMSPCRPSAPAGGVQADHHVGRAGTRHNC